MSSCRLRSRNSCVCCWAFASPPEELYFLHAGPVWGILSMLPRVSVRTLFLLNRHSTCLYTSMVDASVPHQNSYLGTAKSSGGGWVPEEAMPSQWCSYALWSQQPLQQCGRYVVLVLHDLPSQHFKSCKRRLQARPAATCISFGICFVCCLLQGYNWCVDMAGCAPAGVSCSLGGNPHVLQHNSTLTTFLSCPVVVCCCMWPQLW